MKKSHPKSGHLRKDIEEMRQRLEALRHDLVVDVGLTDEDLRTIEETVEMEVEERSQEEAAADRLAPLGERGFRRLRQIDGALSRIEQRRYGRCAKCGVPIALERLRADPTATLCSPCAEQVEQRDESPLASERVRPAPVDSALEDPDDFDEEPTHAAALPAELRALDDAELAALVRETFDDEVEGLEKVRVACRRGRVILGGEVPSEELRQVALRIVEDEIGLEFVDRMLVTEFAAEAETGRERPRPSRGIPPEADLGEEVGEHPRGRGGGP